MKPSLSAVAVLLCTISVPLLNGDVIYTNVDFNTQLHFTDPAFADANWSNTTTITVAPGSSGSMDFDLLFAPNNRGLTFFSTGAVTINQTTLPAGTQEAIVHVSANGAGTFGDFEIGGGWVPAVIGAEGSLFEFTSSISSRRILEYIAPEGAQQRPFSFRNWLAYYGLHARGLVFSVRR